MVAERRFAALLACVILKLVGIEHGDRRHRDHFAGIGVHDDPARALGILRDHLGVKLAFQRALYPAIDRNGERLPAQRRIGQPVIERSLHAHAALPVGIGRKAKHMRGKAALWVEPFFLAREFDADFTQRVHRRHFLGQRAAAQIGPALAGQLLVKCRFRLIGENLVQLARKFGGLADQLRRAHRNGISVHRAREWHAVAIDNVRAGGKESGRIAIPTCPMRENADPGQPQDHHRRDGHEQDQQQHQPIMRDRSQIDPLLASSGAAGLNDDRRHQRAPFLRSRAALSLMSPMVLSSSSLASSIAMRSARRASGLGFDTSASSFAFSAALLAAGLAIFSTLSAAWASRITAMSLRIWVAAGLAGAACGADGRSAELSTIATMTGGAT